MAVPTKQVFVPGLNRSVAFLDPFLMRRGHTKRRSNLHLLGGAQALPTPTLPFSWASFATSIATAFPILGNDTVGDCLYAAGCHAGTSQTGSVNAATALTFNASVVVGDYITLAGGDVGLDEGEITSGWTAPNSLGSMPLCTIWDHLDVNPMNAMLAQAMSYAFGGYLFMLNVPSKWIKDFSLDGTTIWDAPARPDQENGHGIWNYGYAANGNATDLTWGSTVQITPSGIDDCDPSAFAVFSPMWFGRDGYAPNGLHISVLAPMWVAVGGNSSVLQHVANYPPPSGPAPTPTPTPIPMPTPNFPALPPGTYDVSGLKSMTVS